MRLARRLASVAKTEWFLGLTAATSVLFALVGDRIEARLSNPVVLVPVSGWLFGTVLGSALSVVRHAEHLAAELGEPIGTLILTLSVTAIEVMSITAVMLHGDNNPTLVRDTMLAVIMIILNGMVGLSLLLGGLKHREQHYNLQGANTYLGAIMPLAVLALILPSFTVTTEGPTLAAGQARTLALLSLGLYAAFLALQTGRHRGYFTIGGEEEATSRPRESANVRRVLYHGLMLATYMVPVAFLAEELAKPIDVLIEQMHVPVALGGVLIAILVATPEGIGAVHAALANQMQRSVNIFLGSVLSTIGLTVPAMLVISAVTGRSLTLGVEHADLVMLLLTLAVSVVTFASGRSNVLQGIVHLLLFATFVLLIFES
jgi:Ca2+:H+ antiporter